MFGIPTLKRDVVIENYTTPRGSGELETFHPHSLRSLRCLTCETLTSFELLNR